MLLEYLSHLRKKGDKALTIEWNRDKIQKFGQWIHDHYPNKPIDADMIEYYFDYRRNNGLKDSTIAGDARALFAFFKWAKDTNRLSVNPCKDVLKPKHVPCTDEPFSPSELAKLFLYLESIHKLRDNAIISFLYSTSLRITAMTNITMYDINLEKRVAKIKDKYDKRRWVAWGNRTHMLLLNWIKSRNDTCEYLFIQERKPEKLTRSGVYRMFKRACIGAGVNFRKPHLLRSSYACQFLINGGPDREWQLPLIMGLSDDSQIKQVYGQSVIPEIIVSAMIEMDPADRIPVLPLPL